MITTDGAADWLSGFFKLAVIVLELSGTLTILGGAGVATFLFARRWWRGESTEAYGPFRSGLGRSILLGLEFLVAGDIVKSLVINPTLDDLIVLGGLVLVRTFLSISLGVEINGHWPWEETRMSRERGLCGEAGPRSGQAREAVPGDAAPSAKNNQSGDDHA